MEVAAAQATVAASAVEADCWAVAAASSVVEWAAATAEVTARAARATAEAAATALLTGAEREAAQVAVAEEVAKVAAAKVVPVARAELAGAACTAPSRQQRGGCDHRTCWSRLRGWDGTPPQRSSPHIPWWAGRKAGWSGPLARLTARLGRLDYPLACRRPST